MKTNPKAAKDKGFVTLFILMLSISVFLSLGAAMGSNRALQRLNEKYANELGQQAEELGVKVH